jgi:hypothetical protein
VTVVSDCLLAGTDVEQISAQSNDSEFEEEEIRITVTATGVHYDEGHGEQCKLFTLPGTNDSDFN